MKKRTRILALAGIILILAMYASTMIFALMDSPMAKGLFMGSLFCTFAVPVILYGMILAAKVLKGKGTERQNRTDDIPARKEISAETEGEQPSESYPR